ncbi:MAG: hypothetical protein OES09_09050 [Gammaproteobacteria bacterium]|nr:hypothetical protein [Gammaproteobacteria bacterium]
MEQLILTLLMWINQNSGFHYEARADIPNVIQITPQTLVSQMFGRTLSASELKDMKSAIAAYYDHERKTIYLGDRLNIDTAYGKSALLHEFVHFIQYQKGLADSAPCVNVIERSAYSVQSICLQQRRIQPEFDEFTVAIRGLCSNL